VWSHEDLLAPKIALEAVQAGTRATEHAWKPLQAELDSRGWITKGGHRRKPKLTDAGKDRLVDLAVHLWPSPCKKPWRRHWPSCPFQK
jgi:hypothetical protein